jgi:hypothetical protein
MAVEDKFDINLNQNLWGLVVSYAALGVAEHWGLKWLFWPSLIVAGGMSLSVLVTTAFYTWNYCWKKCPVNVRSKTEASQKS